MSLGVKMKVPAASIEAGDFTTYNGYRQATRVEHVTETTGRNPNKVTSLVAIKLWRSDGEVDKITPGQTHTIYRRPA